MTVSSVPNKAAARERRDCAPIPIVDRWRGVGEPGRWPAYE
jgi:hypothetical protein